MNENSLAKINLLIKEKKIKEAQFELSKFGPEFLKDSEYLYLRSKIFYINKLINSLTFNQRRLIIPLKGQGSMLIILLYFPCLLPLQASLFPS